MRVIDFSDGFSNASAPSGVSTNVTSIASYASESAFVTAKASAAATGDMFLDTTANSIKFYEDAAWKTICSLDGTQTLTNKTVTAVAGSVGTPSLGFSDCGFYKVSAGLAGFSSSGTLKWTFGTDTHISEIPLVVKESSAPSTPSSGYAAIYPKSNGKWYSKNDSGSESVLGSGSGSGAKNYLLRDDAIGGQHNGDFEVGADEDTLGSTVGSNVVGWQLFNTTMTGLVPTGTISNGASSITLAKLDSNAITLLGGTLSLVIGTSGGTAISAGDGFLSTTFTNETCDRNTVLNFSFDYYPYIATGCDFSGTSANTFHVYIWDVFNSAWIQPVGVYGMNTTGRPGKCIGSFQTGNSNGSYKLAIICANATTSAAKTISFDNFVVSPEKAVYGTAVKSPALAGFLQDYAGTSAPTGWLLCDGSAVSRTAYADLFTNIGTTWGSGDGSTTFNIPNFQRRVAVGSGGSGTATLANSVGSTGGAETHTLVTGEIPSHSHTLAGTARTTTAGSSQCPDGTFHNINPEVAATQNTGGGGSHNNMQPSAVVYKIIKAYNDQVATFSHETDTRVIAARVGGDAASASSGNPIIFPTASYDTHSAYNTSTGRFTAPTSGYYKVYGYIASSNAGVGIEIYKNGVSNVKVGHTDSELNATEIAGSVQLVAGDIIDLRPGNTLDANSTSSITFERISGPSVIAASEKIYLHYWDNAGTALTADTTNTDFTTKVVDSHGAWSGTVFTAPRAGFYLFMGNVAATTSLNTDWRLWVDGSAVLSSIGSTGTQSQRTLGTFGYYLNAGQQASFRVSNNCTLDSGASHAAHWISICSQG